MMFLNKYFTLRRTDIVIEHEFDIVIYYYPIFFNNFFSNLPYLHVGKVSKCHLIYYRLFIKVN